MASSLVAMRSLLVIVLLVSFFGQHDAVGQTDAEASAALRAAVEGDHRSEANKSRDRYRHSQQTLEFFGFRPDMTVVEIWPGAGWYTDILAPALREQGKLYAAHYGDDPPFPYQRSEMDAFDAKLAAAPEVYGDVTITALDFGDESEIAPASSADLVVTFRNVHNWFDENYGPPDAPERAFAAMFEALMYKSSIFSDKRRVSA
jgi:predicted methyltransferase